MGERTSLHRTHKARRDRQKQNILERERELRNGHVERRLRDPVPDGRSVSEAEDVRGRAHARGDNEDLLRGSRFEKRQEGVDGVRCADDVCFELSGRKSVSDRLWIWSMTVEMTYKLNHIILKDLIRWTTSQKAPSVSEKSVDNQNNRKR